MHTILSHFDLDIDFWPHFYVFPCYITANFLQMCLMLDQFLWGHSSRVCDISCFLQYLDNLPDVRHIDFTISLKWKKCSSILATGTPLNGLQMLRRSYLYGTYLLEVCK